MLVEPMAEDFWGKPVTPPGFEMWDGPDRPLPDHAAVSPPFKSRERELAQAFREAVSLAHEKAAEHDTNQPHPFFRRPHRYVEDADYNCDNPWCQRFWAMVREAEDIAIARDADESSQVAPTSVGSDSER